MKKTVTRITAIAIAILLVASITIVAVTSSRAASKTLSLSAKALHLSVGDTVDINSFYSDGSTTKNIAYFTNNSKTFIK